MKRWWLVWRQLRTERRYNQALLDWKASKITKEQMSLAGMRMHKAREDLLRFEGAIK